MEIEQETSLRFNNERYPTGDYTIWVNQEELNTIVDGLAVIDNNDDDELVRKLWEKLAQFATDRS